MLIFTAVIEQPVLLVAAAVGAAVLSGLASDGALGGVESIWTRAAFLSSSAVYYWYAVLPDRHKEA